jgi:hypothetical protein
MTTVSIPNVGVVKFADGMSQQDIQHAIETDILPKAAGIDAKMPEPSTGEKALVGLGRGFVDVGQGLKQKGLQIGEALGLANPGSADAYTKQTDAERQFYDSTPIGQSGVGDVGRFVGGALPYLAVPGGVAGGLAARAATGALAGAGIGATQYTPEQGSDLFNTALGGALGGAFPLAGGALKVAKDALSKAIPSRMLNGINPDEALATKAAADRIGLNITPAEASGDPISAAMQGRLGTSKKGAQQLYDFSKNRLGQEKQAVRTFLDDLSPDGSSAAEDIRAAAMKSLTGKEQALAKSAKPLYKSSAMQLVPEDKMAALVNEPIITDALKKIGNDPIFASELKGFEPNSIKVLDLTKRNIDDSIESAMRGGEKNKARLLMGAKEKLLSVMDEASPDYAAARSLYSEGAKPLEKLRNSYVGKIANLSDQQLKSVSKTIFDPAQTDVKVLAKMRNEISNNNPEAWRRIIRNEMERRLDQSAGDYAGSTFYGKILRSDRDFKQFMTATEGYPKIQQKLSDMRLAFKDLIEPVSAKTAARLSKSSLDVPRSTMQAAIDFAKNVTGGKYDQAAIKLITSNTWDKEFSKIAKISNKQIKMQKLNALMGKISAIGAVKGVNNAFEGDNNVTQ